MVNLFKKLVGLDDKKNINIEPTIDPEMDNVATEKNSDEDWCLSNSRKNCS